MKKLLLCLSTFCIFVTLAICLTLSASAETVGGNCGAYGDNVKWSLDTDTGKLTISGSGEMFDYNLLYLPLWYNYSSSIKSIEIEEGVTSIGDSAFRECSTLTSITIPEGVTSIGNYGDWKKYDDKQHVKECECGDKLYEDHDFGKGTVTAEPTYTEEGKITHSCVCGDSYTEAIPKLEKDPDSTNSPDETLSSNEPTTDDSDNATENSGCGSNANASAFLILAFTLLPFFIKKVKSKF